MHHTVERWANGFLEQLDKATKLGSELMYHVVAASKGSKSKQVLGLRGDFVHLPTSLLTSNYAAASLRVIFLDYDGTLVAADRVASDSACGAGPPAAVVKLLKFLSDEPDTVVFLMSGRTRSVLTRHFGDLPNLGLAAEKGLFLRWPARLASACRFDRKPEESTTGAASNTEESSSESDSGSDSDEETPPPTEAATLDSPASTVRTEDWECIIPLEENYSDWKSTAKEIIQAYTEQTDGSWIEDKEFAIVWHYESADVEYGRMQSSELQKYLVKILANPKVDVLRYDKSRILEGESRCIDHIRIMQLSSRCSLLCARFVCFSVKPHGVSKGLAATAILESLWIMTNKQIKAAETAASLRSVAP